jgi:hypothetical protein
MKKLSLLIIIAIAFSSCEKKIVTAYYDVPVLRASSIYNGDSVYAYIKKYGESNKELAESYILKSQKAEENDLATAVYACKRAITLWPNTGYYKKLAGLVEKTGNYNELKRVWSSLVYKTYIQDSTGKNEYVNVLGEPDENSFYEYMAAVVRAENYLYGEIVYDAREMGFNVNRLKERLFSDPRLKIDMTTTDAKNMMLLFLSEEELAAYDKLESTFKEMLSSINDVSPVFEITKESVRDFRYNYDDGEYDMEGPTLTYLFVNYLKEKREDPDNWFRYNYNHVIDISDSIKAVIYAIDSSENACPVEMRHIYHRLVTYNQKAEIISSQIVAIQSAEQLKTLSYNMNKFTVTEYKRSWKKPYDKRDFDNYITGTEKIRENSFEILPYGTIKEISAVAVL